MKETQKDWKNQRIWDDIRKKAQMSSQTLKQHAQGQHGSLPGLLCIYYGFKFSGFFNIDIYITYLWRPKEAKGQRIWVVFLGHYCAATSNRGPT